MSTVPPSQMLERLQAMSAEDRQELVASFNALKGDEVIALAKRTATLTGRTAKCAECSRTAPSSDKLAFFEFRGEGSKSAQMLCKCGYYEVAHERKRESGDPHLRDVCEKFTPHGPYETDLYYCGCSGWD